MKNQSSFISFFLSQKILRFVFVNVLLFFSGLILFASNISLIDDLNDESEIKNFESTTSINCPDDLNGFVSLGEFNGSKYFLSEGTSGAPDAQSVAEANGGYLAVINSQDENDFIQQNISEMVYIGLNDFDSEGDLVWVNGDPLDFNNINPCGFCNENADDQDFLIIQPWDGAWSFSNIYNQRKYLIEVPCNIYVYCVFTNRSSKWIYLFSIDNEYFIRRRSS